MRSVALFALLAALCVASAAGAGSLRAKAKAKAAKKAGKHTVLPVHAQAVLDAHHGTGAGLPHGAGPKQPADFHKQTIQPMFNKPIIYPVDSVVQPQIAAAAYAADLYDALHHTKRPCVSPPALAAGHAA